MKLSSEFLENALGKANEGLKGYMEQTKGNPPDNTYVCSIIVSIAYSLILEYHASLKKELKKSNINIGDLEFDKPF